MEVAGIQTKEPLLGILDATVLRVVKADGSPCTSFNVTVPEVVGDQVMLVGVPAVIPVYEGLVKGFVWAAATAANALKKRAVEKRILIC